MSDATEFRFAVGRPSAPHSCVWKLWVRGNDVCIQPRMMGSHAKVSLHESGTGMYSLTAEWLGEKAPRGFTRAERHMRTWAIPQPNGRKSAHVFRIIIPASELRPLESDGNLSTVTWLQAPPPGQAAMVECFLTPPVRSCPDAASSPYDRLAALPCRGRRWFLALSHTDVVREGNARALEEARRQVRAAAQAKGLCPNPSYRAALFVEGTGAAKGLIEMVPF